MMRGLRTLLSVLLLCIAGAQAAAAPQTGPALTAGAAIRDITPRKEWLPLGATGRTTVVDVLDPIHVRAIAIGNGRLQALIVTFEAGGPPDPAVYLKGIADHVGLPTAAIYYGGTHSHSSPSTNIDPAKPTTRAYHDFVYQQMLAAVDEAIANMRPARIGIGTSQSYINVNRQAEYTRPDGTSYGAQGYNPAGPSDKTLSVIRLDDLTGRPIAFVVHYAVHNTVMYANRLTPEGSGISSDIGGAVSSAIEARFTGSVANWIPGAAGDQNPILTNEVFSPSPVTGEQQVTIMSRAVTELRDFYGKVQFADVLRALGTIRTMRADVRVSYAVGAATLPAASPGEPAFPIALKVLRIGDIALVGSTGELFNSTGVYMQSHSPVAHTLVSNQVRDMVPEDIFTGYLPDDYALLHGGFHAEPKRYRVGTIDGGFTKLMRALIARTTGASK